MMMKRMILRRIALVLLILFLSGCSAGQQKFRAAEEMVSEGKYDEAVARYSEAVTKNPDSHNYRMKLLKAREMAAREHVEKGRLLAREGRYSESVDEYRLAIALDPGLEKAKQEMSQVERRITAREMIGEAEKFYRARKYQQAKAVLSRAQELTPDEPLIDELRRKIEKVRLTVIDGQEVAVASDKPITLRFKEADLKEVFNILSQLSGINFLYDEDLGNDQVSVFLENATFAQALELLLKMNELGKKVLNSRTILLYPKTKDKEKQYEDQIIQTFYLSNIDAKKAVNLLRTMLQLRKIFVHEELNALVIRDNPEVIRLSQQILEAADRADSEVVFDLELIEVSRSDNMKLGTTLSPYSVSLGFADKNSEQILSGSLSAGSSTGNLASGLSRLESFYSLPTAVFDFSKTLTDTELLASPQIRVKNKEKAKVHIGSREPIITVTINGDNRSDNVQYVDVGVKLNVEPNIQLDDSVVTKLGLEVSSISDRQTTESGTEVFTITTTNAESVLTLKDGERTVIGGLIRDSKNMTKNTLPFFGDLPLIGNIFSGKSTDTGKREILLSITPHIVKGLDMPRSDVASIWSGGEDEFKTGPNFGSFLPDFSPELEKGAPAAVPAQVKRRPADITRFEEQVPVPEAESRPQPPQQPAERPRREPQESPAATPELPAPAQELREESAVPAPAPSERPRETRAEEIPEMTMPGLEIPAPADFGRVFFAGPSLVSAGDIFRLEVKAAEVDNLYSAPLYVSYDPEALDFVRASEGDFLQRGDKPTIFTTSGGAQPGLIIVGYKQGTGGTGVSGSGTLFNLDFKAKKSGATDIGLERINFRNPQGERLPVTPDGMTVNVR